MRVLCPGDAFNLLLMEDVPELAGVWLKHIHFLSLCLTVEGMDGIWVMDVQSPSSPVEHTACCQEELLLCWGISLGSSSGTLDVLMGTECVPVCGFCSGVMQYGCSSSAALSAPFGEPLSSTVSWNVYPVPFAARNILYMVWSVEIIFLQHLLWAQAGYLGALSQAGDGNGDSSTASPTGDCSTQGLCCVSPSGTREYPGPELLLSHELQLAWQLCCSQLCPTPRTGTLWPWKMPAVISFL